MYNKYMKKIMLVSTISIFLFFVINNKLLNRTYLNNIYYKTIDSYYDFKYNESNDDRYELLTKEDLKHVQVLSQFYSADEIPTNEARFLKAEDFLRKYAEARLVITSTIHVALPCTGLETPVVFLQNMDDSIESTCRFKGLLDLLNVV